MRSGTVENLHDFKGKLDKIKELKIFKKIYAVTLDKCEIKKTSKKYLPNGDLYDMIIIAVEEVDRQSMAPWSSG